ncbi:hypothetical protein [Chamaesiphon sp. VAR_69_metabat_338]|uniref:hypothetical protein n=1 Tax=Chamaesiphon sp. VAR_69_metabat_338 TaxID=2964704 RepID=UPI00286E19C4|nr:hypothetical protein [Chamaesiphon sp. VAR_69_metabat_338]
MKRIYLTAILLSIGLATPLCNLAIFPIKAIAAENDVTGCYRDSQWQITVYRQNGSYYYYGKQNETQAELRLANARITTDGVRRIYTWSNRGTRYQVVWQRRDPDFIRVRVVNPAGQEMLNRLIPSGTECD